MMPDGRPATDAGTPILVAGFPRAGTTWVARVLATAGSRYYVHEPDNESVDPFALRSKRPLGRYPVMAPGEKAEAYEQLWNGVFTGAEPSTSFRARAAWWLLNGTDRNTLQLALDGSTSLPRRMALAARLADPLQASSDGRRILVKTVHSPLCLDWIEARWKVLTVFVVRHPLNVLASWFDLDLLDRDRGLDRSARVRERYTDRWNTPPPSGEDRGMERSAWHLGLFLAALQESHSGGEIVVSHEDVCQDPPSRFRDLCDSLGLPWTNEAAAFLERSNVPGTGFNPQRVASEQIGRWRKTLDADQVELARRTLKRFPISGWPNDGSEP